LQQCFSTAKIVPLSAEGFALQGDVAMAASPIKTCIRGADCPTNFNCRTDLSGPLIEDANWDAFGFLIYGEGWESGQTCASQWGETNKLVAEMLEFYTGTEQSSTVFGFCIPTVEINLDLDQLVETKPGANGVTEIKVKALGPFEGTLPGVADQKNVILVFPPSASERYTWPQEQARRVQWVTFNIPSGTAMTAKLMKGGAEVKSVTLSQDEANMFRFTLYFCVFCSCLCAGLVSVLEGCEFKTHLLTSLLSHIPPGFLSTSATTSCGEGYSKESAS